MRRGETSSSENFLWRRCARLLGPSQINLLRKWEQDPDDLADRLVAHGCVNQNQTSPGPLLADEGRDLARGGGVMSPIENGERAFGNHFQPAGPARLAEPFADGCLGNFPALLGEFASGSNSGNGVLHLKASHQRRAKMVIRVFSYREVKFVAPVASVADRNLGA